MTHKLGANTAIIIENRHPAPPSGNLPAFPHRGTFRPAEIDNLASETGFTPPTWEKFTRLAIRLENINLTLDSADGPGGLLLALTKPFTQIRDIITPWLSPHIEKTGALRNSEIRLSENKNISVFQSLESLHEEHRHHPHAADFLTFRTALDSLALLTGGTGISEININSLPTIFAAFLNGWHTPSGRSKPWAEIISYRLLEEGITFHDVDYIDSFDIQPDSSTDIRTSDEHSFIAGIVAAPETGRFSHPSTVSPATLVSWHDIRCDITNVYIDYENLPDLGMIRKHPDRPPINDNFISWQFNPSEKSLVLSTPIERRYIDSPKHRLKMLLDLIIELTAVETGLDLQPLDFNVQNLQVDPLILPGKSSFFNFPDKITFGDDLYSHMHHGMQIAGKMTDTLKIRLPLT